MATANEIASPPPGDDRAGTGLIDAYEELRAAALGGRSPGGALGTGLLMGKGMAAWAKAWRALPARPTPALASGPTASSPEVVSVLAAMALSCIGG